MARSLLAPGGNNTTGAALSAVPWFAPLGGPLVSTGSVEAEQQFRMGVAGTIDRPGFFTPSAAGVSRTVAIRKGGVTALAYTAPDGSAGSFYGSSGSVAVAAGDLVALSAYASTTAGAVGALSANFRPLTGQAYLLCCSPSGGVNLAITGTRTLSVHGTTLAAANGSVNLRHVVRIGGTLRGAFVYIASNSKTTTTTFTLAINNVDSLVVVTVPAGATGFFFAPLTDTVAFNDDLAWRYSGASNEALLVSTLGVTVDVGSGANSDIYVRPTQTLSRTGSGTASYASVTGQLAFSTTEGQKQIAFGFPARLSLLRAYLSAVAYDGSVAVRVTSGGVPTTTTLAISPSVATGAGFYEDAAHTVDVLAGDLVSLEFTGGTSGSNTYAYLGLTVEDLTPAPSVFAITGTASVSGVGVVPPAPVIPPKSVFAIGASALMIGATNAAPPEGITSRPRGRIITAEITAAIDTSGTLKTFYATDDEFVSQPTDSPPNQAFDGSLTEPGSITITAFGDGRTGGGTQLGTGDLRLTNINGQYDGWLNYSFDGRPLVLRRGKPGAYPADMQTVFTGTVETLTVNRQTITVRLRDKQLMFARKALPNTYAGTNVLPNGIEGTADDLKGQSKPMLFGCGFNIAPPCVNTSKKVYQPNDGACSIDAVYVEGLAIAFAADYPDSAALLAAVLPPGSTYSTCEAEGLFRLAFDPESGEVTCDAAQGATADERTAAQILVQLALLAGLSPSEISAADVTALDAANSASVGIWISGDQTFASAMDAVSGSVGAYYGFDGKGILRMARLDAPVGTPILEVNEYDVIGAPERRPARDGDIPAFAYTIRYARIWSVQEREVAGAVAAARRAYLATEYRAERAEDALVRAQYLLAKEETADTLLIAQAAAATEAGRRLELHKVRRDFFDVTLSDDVLHGIELKIMDLVLIRHSRFGMAGGRLFRLLGLRPELKNNRTTLTLWG